MESNTSNASLRKNEAPAFPTPCNIHFHSIRKRLADPDGLSGKAILDGIVEAGILPNDTTKEVAKVSHTQEKGSVEETIVTLFAIKEGENK